MSLARNGSVGKLLLRSRDPLKLTVNALRSPQSAVWRLIVEPEHLAQEKRYSQRPPWHAVEEFSTSSVDTPSRRLRRYRRMRNMRRSGTPLLRVLATNIRCSRVDPRVPGKLRFQDETSEVVSGANSRNESTSRQKETSRVSQQINADSSGGPLIFLLYNCGWASERLSWGGTRFGRVG